MSTSKSSVLKLCFRAFLQVFQLNFSADKWWRSPTKATSMAVFTDLEDEQVFTNLLERHFATLCLSCPDSIKSNSSLYYLWMGLKCQPVDDSSSICPKACLTCTHLEPTCCHWVNPHCGRRMNTWKLLAMAQWHVDLDLGNVHSEDLIMNYPDSLINGLSENW